MDDPRDAIEAAHEALGRLADSGAGDASRIERELRRLPAARALRVELHDELMQMIADALPMADDPRLRRTLLELALRGAVAKALADARSRERIRLREVGALVGLDVPSLQQLEVGRVHPRSAAMLAALGSALRLPVQWLDAVATETANRLTASRTQRERIRKELTTIATKWVDAPDTRQGRHLRRRYVASDSSAARSELRAPRDLQDLLRKLSDLEPALSEAERKELYERVSDAWRRLADRRSN